MNSLKSIVATSILVIGSFVGLAASAETKVTTQLVDGKKFRDFQLAGLSPRKSLAALQKSFNKLFTQLVENKQDQGKLSENLSMEIKITDIDLEGFYHYAVGPSNQDMRIVDSNTPFRMSFQYKITDKSGKVIKQGKHKINELANSSLRQRLARKQGYAGYYKQPLEKWFDTTFN